MSLVQDTVCIGRPLTPNVTAPIKCHTIAAASPRRSYYRRYAFGWVSSGRSLGARSLSLRRLFDTIKAIEHTSSSSLKTPPGLLSRWVNVGEDTAHRTPTSQHHSASTRPHQPNPPVFVD